MYHAIMVKLIFHKRGYHIGSIMGLKGIWNSAISILDDILTTKGDLITFSTLPIRLAIGSNTTVLTADSAQATGMKWFTPFDYVFSYPLTDETTLPTTGVKYVTEPAAYAYTITDVIGGLTIAGTGAALFTFDILLEDTAPNTNTFTTIFTTKPTIDASEFTTTTAVTPMVLNLTAVAKGKRLQLKIETLDSDSLARGAKIAILYTK